MQISSWASLQAPCTSYVFLCLSLLVCLAAADRDRGRDGSTMLRSLRTARQLQDPDPAADADADAPAVTEAPVSTTDIGKARAREAFDIAWKTAGKATEARAATSKLRSNINKLGAEVSSRDATLQGQTGTMIYAPQAASAEATAKASLQQALANEATVKGILVQVDAKAFQAAQAAAIDEVAKLEKESKEYFESLLAKFKALAGDGPPTAAQAAAKAAQPYIDVELRVGALVQYYNEKAMAELTTAANLQNQARATALKAQWEQSVGIVDWAQRHIMQAHLMIGAANIKKEGAWKIRKLVESLNMSIPSYQRAAQMAAAHALATFSGLQIKRDKAHAEMQRKVFETTHQVDQAFAKLDAALKETVKVLEGLTPPDL